jgi:hypothetical protein
MSNTRRVSAPRDPNVKVPAAVAATAAKIEEFYKKPELVPESPQVVTPEATAAPASEAAAPPSPPAAPEVVQPPAPPPAPAADSWEHKYNSMKGRYDRLAADNRLLTERLGGLESTIAAMQSAPAPTPTVTQLIKPEERETYGEELIDVMSRVAREQLAPVMKEVENVASQLKHVGDHVVQDAKSRMLSLLDENVPNWREINQDERFINWLGFTDTYSGVIKHQLLKKAWSEHNGPRVLAFFTGFLSEEAAVAPLTAEPVLSLAPAPAKVPLESLAAPGRAKTAAAPAPAEKPYFTRAQVTQFYTEVAAGKWRGREQDKAKLEREIHLASREGRLV